MTQDLNSEIEKELTTFMTQNLQQEIKREMKSLSPGLQEKGYIIVYPEDLKNSYVRIAQKTVEAVKVEKKDALWFLDNYFTAENAYPTFKRPNNDKSDLGDLWVAVAAKETYNQAVTEQNKKASAWLGKDN